MQLGKYLENGAIIVINAYGFESNNPSTTIHRYNKKTDNLTKIGYWRFNQSPDELKNVVTKALEPELSKKQKIVDIQVKIKELQEELNKLK